MWLALGRIVVQGLASVGLYEMFTDDNEVNVQGDYVDNSPQTDQQSLLITIGVLFLGLLFALYKVNKK